MFRKLSHSLLLGLGFCFVQSFGESIVGFFITTAKRSSNVNLDGMIYYTTLRILMTLIPYTITFIIIDKISKEKVNPSFISFGLNFIIMIYFYDIGLISKDSTSIIFGSILTSFILILIDKNSLSRTFLKNKL
jgi:hypothetical protein